MPDEYLSPQELSELLGIPLGTIYQWNYRDSGPPRIKVGRHIRYRRSEVEAWADSNRQKAS